jgi:hypothetical protein
MSQLSDDLQQQFQRALADLKTLRDEIKVRLHLAGLEAKTRWNNDLEPRLNELEGQIKDAGEKVSEAARNSLNELAEAVKGFRASLGDKPADQAKPTNQSS